MIRTLQQISALELGDMLVLKQMSPECFEKLAAYAIGYLKGCHDTASQGAAVSSEASYVKIDATSVDLSKIGPRRPLNTEGK